jgi:hypothetical protein
MAAAQQSHSRRLFKYNREYSGDMSGYPDKTEYFQNRLVPYAAPGIVLAALMMVFGILFCICRCCICQCCPSFITGPAAFCFGVHDVPQGGFSAEDRKWPKIGLTFIMTLTVGACIIGYVGNSKVQTEINGVGTALQQGIDHIVDQVDFIAKACTNLGVAADSAKALSSNLGKLKDISALAKKHVTQANGWRTSGINIALISAMGIVAIGLLGSLCNLSFMAMLMCVLAWIALVVTWLCFGLHIGVSVFLDDTCFKVDEYFLSGKRNIDGLDHLFRCPDNPVYKTIHDAVYKTVNVDARNKVNDKTTGLPSLGLETLPAETFFDVQKTQYARQAQGQSAFEKRCNTTLGALELIKKGNSSPQNVQKATALIKVINEMISGSRLNIKLGFFASCEFVRYFMKKMFNAVCGDLMTGFRYVYASFASLGLLMIVTVIFGSKLSNRMDPDNWEENMGKSAEDEEKEQEEEGLLNDDGTKVEPNPIGGDETAKPDAEAAPPPAGGEEAGAPTAGEDGAAQPPPKSASDQV